MIPNAPFIVRVTYRIGTKVAQRNHNCATLSEAFVRKATALGFPATIRVEVMVIIDDIRPRDEAIPG